MKIEMAFIEQSHLQSQMRRITSCISSLPEDHTSVEQIEELFRQMNQCAARYEQLNYALDITNMTIEMDGVALQDKIVEYQLMRDRCQTLKEMLHLGKYCLYNQYKDDVLMMDYHKAIAMHDECCRQKNDAYSKLKRMNWNTELKTIEDDNK
jgi:hypothetical protein